MSTICTLDSAWQADGFGGRELRKAHVGQHTARNPGGRGVHQVSAYDRHLASLPRVAETAAPYGSHANWLAAHNKLLEASTARLAEGKYAQARGLYDLASHVRWAHEAAFGIGDRIHQHGDTGPISNEAHQAYYAMWHSKQQHPIELLHGVMSTRMNAQKRADKVNAHFRRDRDYEVASSSGDRKAIEGWWKKKISDFEANPELLDYSKRAIEKWSGGAKVALTDPNRCDRCGGKGHLDAFKHVEGGTCFECGGSGVKDLGEVMRKALSLRLPLQPLLKAIPCELTDHVVKPDPAATERDALGQLTSARWTCGRYIFQFRKAGKGVPILTVTGAGLPMPYHMVVRGHHDAVSRTPDVARAFDEGSVPLEGVFRQESDAAVRVKYRRTAAASA